MITTKKEERLVPKERLLEGIHGNRSGFKRYKDFFVGPGSFILYEIAVMFLAPLPGALGLQLRKAFYPRLFKRVGSGTVWGQNIALRHPKRISIGNNVAIDDNCTLNAQGSGDAGIVIDDDVLIARNTIMRTKGAGITIGKRCVISSQCQLSAVGGIEIGNNVMIAGQSFIGGGRYKTDDPDTPIMDQPVYSKGAVIIEDDVWIGASAVIQDGVRIGRGSVVGAGAVIREDVPENTVVVPQHRMMMLPRDKG